MNPKEAMEAQWLEPGVNNALKPARWRFIGETLVPDHRPFALDQDDREPLDPFEARYS